MPRENSGLSGLVIRMSRDLLGAFRRGKQAVWAATSVMSANGRKPRTVFVVVVVVIATLFPAARHAYLASLWKLGQQTVRARTRLVSAAARCIPYHILRRLSRLQRITVVASHLQSGANCNWLLTNDYDYNRSSNHDYWLQKVIVIIQWLLIICGLIK